MIVVEKDTPGLTILRDIPSMHDPDVTFGRIGNHAEVCWTMCASRAIT